MHLKLGQAYSRVRRQVDAVEHYLLAMSGKSGEEAAGKASGLALEGLKALAPYLDDLAALQTLADDTEDPQLQGLATTRLVEQVEKFDKLENGATYLRRFPQSRHADAVNGRLEQLAQNLYGEVVLYQNLGDPIKALERIQQILEFAPMTPAAEALREKAVIAG